MTLSALRALAAAIVLAGAAPLASAQTPPTGIEAALKAPDRTSDARFRDKNRKPELILAAADIGEGGRVLDMGAGSGYLSLLASSVVGPTGRVDLHNTPGWIAQFPLMDPEQLSARIRRTNIGYVVAGWEDVPGEAGTYDAILMGQVYHDAVLESADITRMNARLFELLKPGGRLVVEDHHADPSMPVGMQAGLHRLARDLVVRELEAAGFELSAEAEVRTGKDDYRFNVFRPQLRGRTDRYILTFTKPGD